MIYVGLDVYTRFSRMGCFGPATGEVYDLGSVRTTHRPWRRWAGPEDGGAGGGTEQLPYGGPAGVDGGAGLDR